MNTALSVANDKAILGNMIQVLVMAGLLGWSVLFMLKRIAPNFVRNRQYQLATACNTRGWKKIALWLEPALRVDGGCGSGCNSCGSCPANPNQAAEQPVLRKKPISTKSSGCH